VATHCGRAEIWWGLRSRFTAVEAVDEEETLRLVG
jgi:hypothetical protein